MSGHSGVEPAALTVAELDACRPVAQGDRVRAFCPFHGSDHQRSLSVRRGTGWFRCFQCQTQGYVAEWRHEWRAAHIKARETHCWACASVIDSPRFSVCPTCLWIRCRCGACADPRRVTGGCRQPEPGEAKAGVSLGRAPRDGDPDPSTHPARRLSAASQAPRPRPDLGPILAAYLSAWDRAPGQTVGRDYLQARGIALELARRYGVGYAGLHRWAHVADDGQLVADCPLGRLVVPHTTPEGSLVNLYGRAVETTKDGPSRRHDHLRGPKGYFNARALCEGDGPLVVCEGPFDALTLISAGHARTVAIFGVDGWRWDWARDVREIVLALDADRAGQDAWRRLARAARLRAKTVRVIPVEAYGGHKDLNAAWAARTLDLGLLSATGLRLGDSGVDQ